jgi:hypothetical protein
MNPEIIQLPDFVLAELYKNSIVDIENVQTPEPLETTNEVMQPEAETQSQKPLLKFLGDNKKNVVVLLNETKALFINENQLEFLSKVLAACNLTIADIAIINTHSQQVTHTELKEELNAAFILLFGVEPTFIKLPFSIPHFQVQQYNGSTIVYTPTLFEMLPDNNESRSLKRKLWTSLKTAFNI